MKPTLEEVSKHLSYSPETGHVTWISDGTGARGAGRHPGKGQRAGHREKRSGYRIVGLFGMLLKEHHIAWLFMTGEWPAVNSVDHINRVRDDNRWGNLRHAPTITDQRANTKRRSDNSSGFRGVSWDRTLSRWRARIIVRGKIKHLGVFVDKMKAAEAYAAAARTLFGEFCSLEA